MRANASTTCSIGGSPTPSRAVPPFRILCSSSVAGARWSERRGRRCAGPATREGARLRAAHSSQANGDGVAGYRLTLGAGRVPLFLQPSLGLDWRVFDQSGFTERADNGLAAALRPHTAHRVTGRLGVKLEAGPIAIGNRAGWTLQPRAGIA